MSRAGFTSWLVPLAALALLWGVAFSLAAQLTLVPLNVISTDTSVAERLLGASRVAFGERFFLEADNYFHKGVTHVHRKAFTNDYFQSLSEQIVPSGHVHPDGVEVSEIMPWLRVATRMDPNNVEAYLTTAFWLEDTIRRPDVAEAILREAQSNNPKDYRVINARARMLFGTGEDRKAAMLLDTALRFWPSRQNPEDEQARLDLAQMLSYRAFLYEMDGEREHALDLFRKALLAIPGNKALEERVSALERGEDFSRKDREAWQAIFARHHVCAREGDEHDHHDEDHEEHH